MDGSIVWEDTTSGDLPRTVSIDRACRIYRVSRRTVYYWIKGGRVQTKRTLLGSQRVVVESLKGLHPRH